MHLREHEYNTSGMNDKSASRLAPQGDDGCFDFYVALNGRNDLLEGRRLK